MLYFSFYIFTFLLNFIFTFATFIPNERYCHSSVLIDKKLYFIGGFKFVNSSFSSITNEFFYLDVSKPFTTTNNILIPWIDLTYTGGPLKYSATACIGGKNNDMIFIFGGISPLNVIQSFVNQFDTSIQQWINITSVGSVLTDKGGFSFAKFNNGLIAIASGNSTFINITKELWIFDTLTLTGSLSNATNIPYLWGYCAITLPDENILYIGEHNAINLLDFAPMNNGTSGQTPPGRDSFSAVLTFDGRIIIFGGHNEIASLGDLWILDITMFQWSIGNIFNPIVDFIPYEHTATLVDNYMFVAFGKFINGSYSSKISILDVSQKNSYKWVTEFIPNTTTTTTITATTSNSISNNTKSSDSKNTSRIIGSIVSLIIIFVIASVLTLKFIDKYK
ncbi:galactose oxidase [Gigaspora margarita]|uniref:Galactose oxidase n=1 Tax=Gigaspora margarita TaxID=4874 RepID=A0A8H4AIY9_GIGMA|nr:galactose oxidase [Gigaspora margarita]